MTLNVTQSETLVLKSHNLCNKPTTYSIVCVCHVCASESNSLIIHYHIVKIRVAVLSS